MSRPLKIWFCQFAHCTSLFLLRSAIAPKMKVRSREKSDWAISKSDVPSSGYCIDKRKRIIADWFLDCMYCSLRCTHLETNVCLYSQHTYCIFTAPQLSIGPCQPWGGPPIVENIVQKMSQDSSKLCVPESGIWKLKTQLRIICTGPYSRFYRYNAYMII